MYGQGISREGCIVDMGVEAGVVKKSGAWYTYGEDRLGQGREAAKEMLRTHPDVRDEIEQRFEIISRFPRSSLSAKPRNKPFRARFLPMAKRAFSLSWRLGPICRISISNMQKSF